MHEGGGEGHDVRHKGEHDDAQEDGERQAGEAGAVAQLGFDFVRQYGDEYEIVDGYHRYTVMCTSERVRKREGGMLPVVVIDKPISHRMASTIRHNRARGAHSIDLMRNIVAELVAAGMGDAWIRKHIGMDEDELLRLKQLTGIAALFADRDFSNAWEPEDNETI